MITLQLWPIINRDNDRSSLNCASMLKGGWWWKSCGRGLNGIYLTDPQDLTARQGKLHRNLSQLWPNAILNLKNIRFFFFFSYRYCVVPLARMGLHAQTGYHDDSTETLWQRTVHAQPTIINKKKTTIIKKSTKNKYIYKYSTINTHQLIHCHHNHQLFPLLFPYSHSLFPFVCLLRSFSLFRLNFMFFFK